MRLDRLNMMHLGINAENELIKILNREIIKEVAKEQFKDSNKCGDEAATNNMRLCNICLEESDLEGALEALSRVVQIRVRQINIKHCS